MSIMVTTTMLGSYERMIAGVEAHPELMPPFLEAVEKFGRIDHGHLVSDGKVIELAEFATREDHAGLSESIAWILEILDSENGVTSKTVEIFEYDPPFI